MYKRLNIILIILMCLLLPINVLAQSYGKTGESTNFNGDVGVPSGSSYYIGDVEMVKFSKWDATVPPNADNDVSEGYKPGSIWIDLTGDRQYTCLDNTDGDAIWSAPFTMWVRADEAIEKGDPVYISGSLGSARPKVKLVDADLEVAHHMIGAAVADIANGDNGFIRTSGAIKSVDTEGVTDANPGDEDWTAGDHLYATLDGGGGYTNVRPTSGMVILAAFTLLGDHDADTILVVANVNDSDMAAAAGEDIRIRLGADDGSTDMHIKNFSDVLVASIDDQGEILGSNVKRNKMDGTQAPDVDNDTDEGYEVGSNWYDETNDKAYICLDNTDGAAVWTETTAEGAGETNTASNVGSEAEIFKQKTDEDLEFRTLKEGTAINFTYEYGVTLKISNTSYDNSGIVYFNTYIGQWWLAGSTYVLGEIQLLLYRIGDGETVTLYVFNADGDNKPTGGELGHIELDLASITTSTAGEYVTFDLSSFDITITNGNKYSFYLVGESDNSDHSIALNHNVPSVIDNSARITSDDSGSSWTVGATKDAAFKIYTKASYYDYIQIGVVLDEIIKNYYSALSSDHTYSDNADTDSQPVGENVVFGDFLYKDWTLGEWMKAQADDFASTPALRIALESKSDGQTCLMLVKGYIRDDSAFDFGASRIFLNDDTAGTADDTAPAEEGDQIQIVGTAISADVLFFDPSKDVGEI